VTYHSKHLGADIAGKDDSARLAPNPAVAEMIAHLDGSGVETVLDRLDAQSPQCGFGLRGLCCTMCQWGPCRISAKSPRGVCGRSTELIVTANLLRAVAAGAAAQTIHARELILTLQAVVDGTVSLSVKGLKRLRDVDSALNISMPWTPMDEVVPKVAQVLLDDLGRLTGGRMRTMGFAPRERRALWEKLGVTPRSAAFEIVESMHMTTLGACSDWEELFRQAVRTSLAHVYTALVPSSVLSDILFGIPEPRVAEVNYGILKPDHVNVLVHGHSAVMLEKVLEKIGSDEIQALARERGAEGIVVGGMCCSGHESLARYGVPTVTGAMGQELVVGTGAIDAVVVDMQCVLPGMAAVAACFGTEIITTCRSNRIPGATHVPFDPEHPEALDEDAMRVARTAVEAFSNRDRTKMHIPDHTTKVMVGFTRESVMSSLGSARKVVLAMRRGDIRGVVAMVGCTTPKIAYETGHVTIARELVRNGVLVLTSGCSSHALLNAGLCSTEAAADAAPGLRAVCEEAGIPPVLAIGSCADNTRVIQVFAQLAHEAHADLPAMPFVVSGPELANEKTMGQMVGVLAHGITTVVGLTPRLPIPAMEPAGGDPIADFFCGEGLVSLLGARLLVEPDPHEAAAAILRVLDEKREGLEWDGADELAEATA
jgi:anaerobic carbon-monoxide dehydrogenase catalytic subunit